MFEKIAPDARELRQRIVALGNGVFFRADVQQETGPSGSLWIESGCGANEDNGRSVCRSRVSEQVRDWLSSLEILRDTLR